MTVEMKTVGIVGLDETMRFSSSMEGTAVEAGTGKEKEIEVMQDNIEWFPGLSDPIIDGRTWRACVEPTCIIVIGAPRQVSAAP